MGLTCAQIHIHLASASTADKSSIEKDFERALVEAGFEITNKRLSKRSLVTVVTGDWITVFDEDSGGVLTRASFELARRISKATEQPVVATSLLDSNDCAFVVFEGGKQVDGIASDENVLPVRLQQWPARRRAAEWSRMFSQSISARDLAQAFRTSSPFSEDALQRLCQQVAVPVEMVLTTSQDLVRPSSQARVWYLRTTGDDDMPGATQIGGQAGFDSGTPLTLALLIGEPSTLAFELSAEVAALADPVFEVSGPALDQGLVEVTRMNGVWHCGLTHVRRGGAIQFRADVRIERTQSGSVVTGRSEALSRESLQHAPKTNITLAYWIWLRASAVGAGDLNCALRCDSNDDRRIELKPSCRVAVTVPDWTPAGSTSIPSVRRLNSCKVLSAVAIVADRDARSLELLRVAMENWLRWLGHIQESRVETRHERQMNPETFTVPRKTPKFKPNDVGTSKKWKNLWREPEAMQSAFFSMTAVGESEPWAGGSIQRPVRCLDDPQPTGALHVGFWIDLGVAESTNEGVEAIKQRLIGQIDELFRRLSALQAWIACWDWIPHFTTADENGYTPYEGAYSLDNPTVEHTIAVASFMHEDWCNQHLRGLGECLWLGSRLGRRVKGRTIPPTVESASIGTHTRLQVPTKRDLASLEVVLAPLVPPIPNAPFASQS